ncbi:MAG: hypothetical protein QOC81_1660 [Thermoanaerobaculia bacterium]|jgi:hypothetical protein|nr:hypothetical protein [Thermoanaerobaculia bacterium]
MSVDAAGVVASGRRITRVRAQTRGSSAWIRSLLTRNANSAYLRQYDSPLTIDAFRDSVPVVDYDDLLPWLDRIREGESDVLFAGRPIAFERTGGSSGAAKLIPYSSEGLRDFQRSVSPWFADVVKRHGITGRVYFSISPATRQPESIGGVPVGLPDGAYLGDSGAALLAKMTAVPFDVASIAIVERWREETLRHLKAARDLELISVWSPTFLLRLLDDLDDPQRLWPRLKVVSCWAAASSKPFADEVATRLPHAHLQPKGLLSTETVVTVPDDFDRPVLTENGFFEFEREGRLFLSHELRAGDVYEVIATTASGLYRYRTSDLVRYDGLNSSGRPVLEFVGRGNLVSDLVGEKLTEPFVASCLEPVPGFRLLVPEPRANGYVLLAEAGVAVDIDDVERRLCDNPQYAYARRLGQLNPLRLMPVASLFDRYAQACVVLGVRLGDVKPAALRNERDWLDRIGGRS